MAPPPRAPAGSSPRIDAHQHFWRFEAERYPWIDAGMARLRRDFLPEHLSAHLAAQGIDGCIAVQACSSLDETLWLLDLAREAPFVRGVVGWLDLRADDLEETIARVRSDGAPLVGVRHVVQDEPDDRFLDDPTFRRGVRRAADLGLVYDLLIYPRQLPAALDFVRALDDVPIVLDHCAKPPLARGGSSVEMRRWEEQLRALGECTNLCCKVSGLVTEADWRGADAGAVDAAADRAAAVALEAFGPSRLVAGSDWPVCELAAPYARALGAAARLASHLSSAERDAVLGGNACRVYGLAPLARA